MMFNRVFTAAPILSLSDTPERPSRRPAAGVLVATCSTWGRGAAAFDPRPARSRNLSNVKVTTTGISPG